MKRSVVITVIVLVVALAGLGYWYFSAPSGDEVTTDLVEAFRGAEKRSSLNVNQAFSMDPQTIQGVTRPSVYMHPSSRVTYKAVAVPEHGHLRAWLGVKEEAWDKGTDGVYFSIGVSSEHAFEEILKQMVDPCHNPKDRAWIPVNLDLSKWAGKQVDVVFNTRPSAPGFQPNDLYDFAVIGDPAIVIRTDSRVDLDMISPEAFVEECFQRFLQRPADEEAVAFYARRLREGAAPMDVVQTLVTGREFFGLLCKGVFGRELVTPFLAFAPPGHYYSPLPSPEDVARYAPAAWARGPESLVGLDLDVPGQLAMVETLGRQTRDLHFDADRGGATRYYWDNDGFGPGDAVALAAMMRHARPSRIIEVGAGYSTAVMLDVAERHLATPPRITCIDPEPQRLRALLRDGDTARLTIHESIVQDLPVSFFTDLTAGDILFIDSSHVLKLGSDVAFLLLEVLPRLAPGVFVHVHDIACSFEYPIEWYEEGRAWNEAPALRAFLAFNRDYRIVFFADYLMRFEREAIAAHMPLALRQPKAIPQGNTSVSFWMVREAPSPARA